MFPIFITVFASQSNRSNHLEAFYFFSTHIFSHRKPVSISKCHIRSCDTLLVLVNFPVIRAWPKVTHGRSLLWLTFQREKSPLRQANMHAAGTVAGAGSWETTSCTTITKRGGLEIGLAYIISKPTPRGVLPPSMLYPPPQTAPPTGDQVCRRHFSSKTPKSRIPLWDLYYKELTKHVWEAVLLLLFHVATLNQACQSGSDTWSFPQQLLSLGSSCLRPAQLWGNWNKLDSSWHHQG